MSQKKEVGGLGGGVHSAPQPSSWPRGPLLPTLALLALAVTAAAQPTRQVVQDAQRAAEERRATAEEAARRVAEAAAEERRLAEQRVAAARRVQAAETALDAAMERLRQADAAGEAAQREAARRAAVIAPMLPAMRRLALWPAETLLAVPVAPEEALRGALVLQGLARRLREEAEAYREARREARRQAVAVTEQASHVAAARADAQDAAAALEAELAAARTRHAAARAAGQEAERRAQEALARASDLQEVLARIERQRAREEAEAAARERAEQRRRAAEARAAPEATAARPPDPPPARAGRAMPVAGRIVRDFGDAGEGGPARGVTLSAAAGARVVSPCAGRVAFSGPFRSYGLLLIVDCGEGHHVVMAGLDRLDAAMGTRVLAGEPVGVLGEGASGRASFYLELRRNGATVDPRPWLAARG